MGRAGRTYRRVRATLIGEPTNFGWVIDRSLAGSGLPSSSGQVRWLESHGIDTIITLTEGPLPPKYLKGRKVNSIHVQMFDHAAPSQDALITAVRHIRSEVEKGNAVLVHCLAGIGRTGTVISAYMMEYQGKDADQVLSELRTLRPGSVERSQESAVREYYKNLKEAKRPQ